MAVQAAALFVFDEGNREQAPDVLSFMRLAFPLLLFVALVGCNPGDASELKQDTGKLAESAGKVAESAGKASVNVGLVAKVNSHLALHKGIELRTLHIEAKDGVVKVGGHVKTTEEKRKVMQVVLDTPGVTKTEDDLRIEP